jgi:hypothetical protein
MFAEQNRDRKAKYAEFFSNISQSEAKEALILKTSFLSMRT